MRSDFLEWLVSAGKVFPPTVLCTRAHAGYQLDTHICLHSVFQLRLTDLTVGIWVSSHSIMFIIECSESSSILVVAKNETSL